MYTASAAIKSCRRVAQYLTGTGVCALMLTACGGGNDATWVSVPSAKWQYGDTLQFVLPEDAPASRDLVLWVRHDDAYQYSNLWVEVAYDTRDTVLADTFDITLADDYGRWRGVGNGTLLQYADTLTLRDKPVAGKPLRVRHIMRVQTVEGIEQVGIEHGQPTKPDAPDA